MATRVVQVDGVDHVQEIDAVGQPVGDLMGPEFVAEMKRRATLAWLQLPAVERETRRVLRQVGGLEREYEQDLDEHGAPIGDYREVTS